MILASADCDTYHQLIRYERDVELIRTVKADFQMPVFSRNLRSPMKFFRAGFVIMVAVLGTSRSDGPNL